VLVETQAVTLTGEDSEGVLVLSNGAVVAVIAKLGPTHGEAEGSWYTEATFGIDAREKVFPDLDAVRAHFEVLLLAVDARSKRQ
jgi:hypothetical protein